MLCWPVLERLNIEIITNEKSLIKMENGVYDKSFAFAIRIIKLNKYLTQSHKEYVMSKQMIRSGTAVGALIREAKHGESKADFTHKMSIALKEANETVYWLELLNATDYINKDEFTSIHEDAIELVKMLASIVKSSKTNK